MAFDGHMCCWHIYGSSMVNKYTVIFGLNVDYSNSRVRHVSVMWKTYLFRTFQ